MCAYFPYDLLFIVNFLFIVTALIFYQSLSSTNKTGRQVIFLFSLKSVTFRPKLVEVIQQLFLLIKHSELVI